MQDSFLSLDEDKDIPIEPFITCQDQPTKLHLIFSRKIAVDEISKNVDFEYILCLTKEEVIGETLLSYPYKRKRLIYQRTQNIIKQGSKITHLESEIWNNLRKNCSIVSFAAQFNSQVTAKYCKNFPFKSNLSYKGIIEYQFNSDVFEELIENYNFSKEEIVQLFKIADLGINDFELIKKTKYTSKLKELITRWINLNIDQENIAITKDNGDFINLLKSILNSNSPSDNDSTYFPKYTKQINSIKDDNILLIRHQIDGELLDLDYSLESSGTLQFFTLLNRIMITLKQGSIFIIDEIEIKLHQNLVAYIIGLFQNKYENPHGAQLIFSFHNTYFMDILEPSQLWFTEKNDQGYTEIFSAADFKDIKKLQQRSLEELYRLGRFGAKPRGI